MDVNRFFVGWLLVAGLVGVYAQYGDEDSSEKLTAWIAPPSKYRTLDESASAPNPTNEDSSAHTDFFGFVNEAGSHENFNPGGSTSRVSQEDYDWYFKKGEEVLRRLSDETHKKRANGEWLDPQMQSHHRRIPLDESASAANPTNEDSSAATDVFRFVSDAGLRDNLNPGSSTSRMSQEDYDWHFKEGEEVLRSLSDETNNKRANGEWLDPQMQSHHRRIPVKTKWDDWYPISIRDRIPSELAAFERGVFDKREGQSITKGRVPEKKLNKPGPSRLETSKEKANRELLPGPGPAINANSASPYKREKLVRWLPEEENIILKEFKEYIDAKKLPPSREIKTVIDKHQLLRIRTVASIKTWIQKHIKKNN